MKQTMAPRVAVAEHQFHWNDLNAARVITGRTVAARRPGPGAQPCRVVPTPHWGYEKQRHGQTSEASSATPAGRGASLGGRHVDSLDGGSAPDPTPGSPARPYQAGDRAAPCPRNRLTSPLSSRRCIAIARIALKRELGFAKDRAVVPILKATLRERRRRKTASPSSEIAGGKRHLKRRSGHHG